MTITLKPLTVFVDYNQEADTASITVKNETGDVAIGPLVHHFCSLNENWKGSITDHIAQLVGRGMNIVALESNTSGITL